MTDDDVVMVSGWGHFETGEAVMPGQGRVFEQSFMVGKSAAFDKALPALGTTKFDIHVNCPFLPTDGAGRLIQLGARVKAH